MTDTYALLPYQRRWLEDKARVTVIEKSRRIGITWATASDCILDAADGTCDTWYLAYAEDAAQEFILDCGKWAENMGLTEHAAVEGVSLLDPETGELLDPALGKEGIRAFSLKFRSGKRITALSSSPRNLRGKAGRVIVDEAAFHPDLRGVLKACMSLLMWGGGARVQIISTHFGVDNPFNTLVQEIKDGQHPSYSLHSVDLDQALAEGLYRRICLVNKEPWTPKKEAEWRAQVVREHGVDADEELFLRPSTNAGAGWFARSKLKLVDSIRDISFRPPSVKRAIRFWDLAATEVSAMAPDPDWTAGARVLALSDGNFLIDDMERFRAGPANVEAALLDIAEADGRQVEVGTWQDPGAAGKSDASAKGRALTGYVFHSPRASKNKTDFAKPWASLAQQGRIYVLRRDWTEYLLRELERFPGGKHDDQVDAISGAFEVLVNQGGYSETWARAWGNK